MIQSPESQPWAPKARRPTEKSAQEERDRMAVIMLFLVAIFVCALIALGLVSG